MVKDAIPNCIRDELRYSMEDVSTFEGFKRAVLCIDNDYWKRIQDDKNKPRNNRSLHSHIPKTPRQEPIRNAWPEERTNTFEKSLKFPATLGTTSGPSPLRIPTSDVLGADGRLTPVE